MIGEVDDYGIKQVDDAVEEVIFKGPIWMVTTCLLIPIFEVFFGVFLYFRVRTISYVVRRQAKSPDVTNF